MSREPSPDTLTDRGVTLVATLFAFAALAIVVYVRIRLAGVPFERDEGEYAYAGQLLLKGCPPYLHAYTMKLPGMAYLSALFLACFGKGITAIHAGLMVANIISGILVFLLGKRLFNTPCGLFGAGVYLLATLSDRFLGTFAHATQFVNCFVLAAYLCFLSDGNRPLPLHRYLFSGILLGCAVLVKQHAILFAAAAAVTILTSVRPRSLAVRNILILLAGITLPYAVALVPIAARGTLSRFMLWTAGYAIDYATGLTAAIGIRNFVSEAVNILGSLFPYILLALAGLILLLRERDRSALAILLPLAVAAFAAITPGYYFRAHYFVLIVPAGSLLAGRVAGAIRLPGKGSILLLAAFFVAASYQILQERLYLLAHSTESYLLNTYGTAKPFSETVALADYLKRQTTPTDLIQVLGSEPQIYFYADRIASSGYIYMYPLMEEHPRTAVMQQEMLDDLACRPPKYIVLVDDDSSWLNTTSRGTRFRSRLGDLVTSGYELDGIIAKPSAGAEPFFVFGANARMFASARGPRVLVFKKRGT